MSTAQALVVGESLIDVVHGAAGIASRTAGAASLNIATALARLVPGASVSFLTDLGTDADGALLRRRLEAAGVTVLAEPRGVSSLAHPRLDRTGSAEYVFELRWEPQVSAVPERPWQALHVGSIGAFLAPGSRAVDALLRWVAEAGTVRSFDPNIRPALLPDHAAALGRFEALARQSDVVKLSDADAAWLYPHDGDPGSTLDRLLAMGPGLVVLTRGAEGSTLRTPALSVDIAAAEVEVADTIGAGDSFMAVLIAELLKRGVTRGRVARLERDDLEAIGAEAARIAGIVVSRVGAGIPDSAL
ncbi:PfkB family carbohydrate kinase [Herbiconiux sp.]|uniref:PfkB family carbohydrate kinase n=1 Tax=Herbiconiux sp. TaxID=1871186 RepID=UPI0025C1C0D2|nr:PfkB family carbohydrate kinase [Herbiconiux sp.]